MLRTLVDADVPHSVVNSAADIVADPHTKARGNLITAEDFQGKPLPMQGVVPLLRERPGTVRWSGEPLGASTRQVLGEALGLTPMEIDELVGAGVAGKSIEHEGGIP